ncbi:MAG: hypothetical protein ACOC3V_00465 [bacterium]
MKKEKVMKKENVIEIQEEVKISQKDTIIILEKGDKIKILNEYNNNKEIVQKGQELLGRASAENALITPEEKSETKFLLRKNNWDDNDIETAYLIITKAYERGAYNNIVAGPDYALRMINSVQNYLNDYWNISPPTNN